MDANSNPIEHFLVEKLLSVQSLLVEYCHLSNFSVWLAFGGKSCCSGVSLSLLYGMADLGNIQSKVGSQLLHVELEVVRNYLKQFGDLETEDLENIARLARGRIGWAHQSATDPEFLNETLLSLDKVGNLAFTNLEERFGYAKELASRFRKDRRIGYNDIDNLLTWWRDLLMVCSDQDGYVINLLHMEKFRKIS